MTSVCVVLVTFNRKELLLECLRGLLQQTRRVDHILIVDNGSTDGTLATLEAEGYVREPLVEVHREAQNLGGAGGFAVGMKMACEAGYGWAWLMDDDAEPASNALEEALAHEDDSSVAAIANFKVSPDRVPQDNHMRLLSGIPAHRFAGERQSQELAFSSFVGLLVRTEAITAIGLPKVEFFLNQDDNEYSQRLVKHGRILLAPASVIVHKEAMQTGMAQRRFLGWTSQRLPLRRYVFRYFEMRNGLWMYGAKKGSIRMILAAVYRVVAYSAAVVLFRDDHPSLRICVIVKSHTDAILENFDNRYPFRLLG